MYGYMLVLYEQLYMYQQTDGLKFQTLVNIMDSVICQHLSDFSWLISMAWSHNSRWL